MTGVDVSTLHTDRCPQCGTDVVSYDISQDALFRLGGYGATMRTVQVVCPECGWTIVREVSETRPPKGTP